MKRKRLTVKAREARTAPTLIKVCSGSITGWWDCLRCGWSLPGQLNPENHNCRADNPEYAKKAKKAGRR